MKIILFIRNQRLKIGGTFRSNRIFGDMGNFCEFLGVKMECGYLFLWRLYTYLNIYRCNYIIVGICNKIIQRMRVEKNESCCIWMIIEFE